MAFLRRSHSECSHSLSALWYGLQCRGHFQLVCRVGTLQNPKLGQFILRGCLPLCLIYKNGSVPLRMCLLCQESHETLNWGSLFHVISPLYLPLAGQSLFKKPVKLWCKTRECDTSWFKTTIHDENMIVRAYINNPLKGNFQSYTCKSYLVALFFTH